MESMSSLGDRALGGLGQKIQIPDSDFLSRPPLLLLLDGHAMINRASHAFDRNPMTLKQT